MHRVGDAHSSAPARQGLPDPALTLIHEARLRTRWDVFGALSTLDGTCLLHGPSGAGSLECLHATDVTCAASKVHSFTSAIPRAAYLSGA